MQSNSRLEQFIGNNPLCEDNQGGEPLYKETFSSANFFEPVSKHQEYLHEYAMQVQKIMHPENKVTFDK